ncbi:GNAT family N-acetyltransferase [Polaribacter sp.]|uniref:GNAT family N-acetyltransferase n=1 Tax=Polaribacter sp. TaxID=1920175 RepID=UPI003EF7CCAF
MHPIKKATVKDAKLLSKIGKASFISSHGHSASHEDILNYVADNFSENNFVKELQNKENLYYLIENKNNIVGYAKVVLNAINENITDKNITLLSRLYLLEECYGLNLGKEMFKFCIELSKQNHQKGMWLAVWVENKRAINFYEKRGFVKVGTYDFKISETHYNPNYILYLEF